MPWAPELFSTPVLQRVLDKMRRDKLLSVPYFDGFMAGEPDALVESFAGEPLVYDPLRGRIKGEAAFRAFVARTTEWLEERNVTAEYVTLAEGGGFEEVVLHFDGGTGQIALPCATVTDRRADGRIEEVRVYHSTLPLRGRHACRPPMLQPGPELREPGVVAEYQRALAAGDVDAIVAAFEPGARAGVRAFYEELFSHGGGIAQEQCAIAGDGRARALEYNAVRWGSTELLPQAGVAVYVRGESGKLAAVRIYDDVEPPPEPVT
jgi:hypothetical protein